MRLEREIERYIQENNWDLNYSGNTITNIFGTDYNVVFACTEGYFDVSNVHYGSREILIKDACEFHQDMFGAQEGVAYMTKALAHEITHTETYAISAALGISLAGLGIVKAIQSKDPKELVKGALSGLIGKFLLDEILAETGAYFIHNAGTEVKIDLYKALLDLL